MLSDRKVLKIEMEKKMNKLQILVVTIILVLCLTLTACSADKLPAATETPQVNMPNPAALYCKEKGYTYEIRTAADGSQSGVCIFPDKSECDDWEYFRGECNPKIPVNPKPFATAEVTPNASGGYVQPGASEPFADWWGVIKSTESGSQYDDYFERQDMGGAINFGIDSLDSRIRTQIENLRDSGKIVHLYGKLFSNVPDYNGSLVQVDRIEVEG